MDDRVIPLWLERTIFTLLAVACIYTGWIIGSVVPS